MTVPIRLIIMALAMSAVLIAMAGLHAAQRAGGTEIRLDMLAVDPRDPLLGHYVVIETPLHVLDPEDFGSVQTRFSSGDDIFVILRHDEQTGAWSPASLQRQRPREGVVIRGKVESVILRFDRMETEDGGWVNDPESRHERLRMRYNLERYYASRDEALALENLREGGRLRLIVSVNRLGHAVIKGLEIDGEDRLDRLF